MTRLLDDLKEMDAKEVAWQSKEEMEETMKMEEEEEEE